MIVVMVSLGCDGDVSFLFHLHETKSVPSFKQTEILNKRTYLPLTARQTKRLAGSHIHFVQSILSSPPPIMSHYTLIHDPSQVLVFAALFCTDLIRDSSNQSLHDDVKLLSLFCREKYRRDGGKFSRNAIRLGHQLIRHADPRAFLREIQKMEVPYGAYVDAPCSSELPPQPIPHNTFALYLDLQSKSPLQAFLLLQQQVQTALYQRAQGNTDGGVTHILEHIPDQLQSCIHKSSITHSRQCHSWYDIDVDTKDPVKLAWFIEQTFHVIEKAIGCIIESHGGFHIVLDSTEYTSQTPHFLHKFFSQPAVHYTDLDRNGKECPQTWVSRNASAQVPVPGVLQGRFPVRMITVEEFKARAHPVSPPQVQP